jgi:methylthioribulose-1-phosphate dehydratase
MARDFYARGWMSGTSGNLSAVVDRNPLRLAITASGIDKRTIGPQHILTIDEAGMLVGQSDLKPSDERLLHLKLATFKKAGAILHTHSLWSTILSARYREIGALSIEGYEMLKGLEGIRTHTHREWLPILENDQNIAALAERLDATFESYPDAHGFLLAGHGLYTWGRDLATARRHVEIIEFLLEVLGRR